MFETLAGWVYALFAAFDHEGGIQKWFEELAVKIFANWQTSLTIFALVMLPLTFISAYASFLLLRSMQREEALKKGLVRDNKTKSKAQRLKDSKKNK